MTDGALTLQRQSRMVLSDYRKGLALVLAGTITASFEGLLVRMISADSWSVIFWRGVLLGLAMMSFIVWSRRPFVIRVLSRAGLIAVAAYAANVTFFISAINATTVANTLVIASAAPLFAALIAWVALGERPSKATMIAVLVVVAGLAVIFSGSLGLGPTANLDPERRFWHWAMPSRWPRISSRCSAAQRRMSHQSWRSAACSQASSHGRLRAISR